MLFSPAALTVVAAVLAGGWILARRNAEAIYSLDGLTWMQLSTRSWFTRSWAFSAAILAAPALVGFGIGWMAHRRVASAASTAVAAVAMIAFAMVQLGQKREVDAGASKPATAAVARPATSGMGLGSPGDKAGLKADGAQTTGDDAASTQARVKPEEEPATGEPVESAKAGKAQAGDDLKPPQVSKPVAMAGPQKRQATPAPAVESTTDSASVLFGDRSRLVVQSDSSPSISTAGRPGVRPSGATAQVEREGDHPSFPGCRWATPTQWVCDGAKR